MESATTFLLRHKSNHLNFSTHPFKGTEQLQSNSHRSPATMPAIRSARNRKPPPDGFDDIEDTLLEFANKMKDAENASHEGKKKHEMLWPIFQITHQRRCP